MHVKVAAEVRNLDQARQLADDVSTEGLDFLLEQMTAFDVLDELKADPRTRDIPVVIITSHTLDDVDRQRLAKQTDSIVSKDKLSRELAMSRIRDALRKAGLGPQDGSSAGQLGKGHGGGDA